MTAGIAFGVLLYWLVGRKADNAIQQRGAESMGEAAMRQPMDALPTRSWLRQPYNLSLGRVLRSPTRARTGIDQINALTFALGPGAHWSTIVGTVAGMTVVAVVFLLAVGPELRMGLKYSQTWFILMMVGILAVQSYQDRVAKRNIEISLLMLTPAWPGTYKARDLFAYQAAAYFAVLIVAVVVAALVVRGIPDDVVRWADTRPPAWFLVYSGIVLWLAAVVVAWQLMLRGDWRSRKSKLPDRLAYFVISVLPLFLLFILDRKAPEYLPPASGLLLIVLIGLAWCQLLRLRKA